MRAVVYANQGYWLADCPRPGCANAEHAGPDPVNGHVGGLTGAVFRCSNCAPVCEAVWPPNVDDIERLLRLRPVPQNRNWWPGETLHDLLAENVEQGAVPVAALEAGGWISIAGDHIDPGSALPAPTRRPALGRH